MPVRGTVVQPSADTNTPRAPTEQDIDPGALAVAEAFLLELQVPSRVKFTPSQLATDLGGTARAWQRECSLGNIGAVRLPGGWVVTRTRLLRYLAARQNLVSLN